MHVSPCAVFLQSSAVGSSIRITIGKCRLEALLELRVELRRRADKASTSTTGVSASGSPSSSAEHRNYVLTQQCYLPLNLDSQLPRTFVSHPSGSCLQAQSTNTAAS